MKSNVSASLIRGNEAIVGDLLFEEDQLVFNSYQGKAQVNYAILPYQDMTDVKPCKTLGFIPNGFSITMQNDEEFQFVVMGRKEIIKFIREKAGITGDSPAT